MPAISSPPHAHFTYLSASDIDDAKLSQNRDRARSHLKNSHIWRHLNAITLAPMPSLVYFLPLGYRNVTIPEGSEGGHILPGISALKHDWYRNSAVITVITARRYAIFIYRYRHAGHDEVSFYKNRKRE